MFPPVCVCCVQQVPGYPDTVADLPSLLRVNKRVNLSVCRVTYFPAAGGRDDTGLAEQYDLPTPAAPSRLSTSGNVMVELVSTAQLEWRVVLASGEKALALELVGIGDEAKMGVPVGILTLDLKLSPPPGAVTAIPAVSDCGARGLSVCPGE